MNNLPINQIIQGDCLEVLKALPDKSVDLVLTDPPYESEAHTLKRRVKRGGVIMEIESLDFPAITQELRADVSREIARLATKWVLVFCQVEASHLWREELEKHGLVYKRTCIWVKPDGMPQYSGDRPGMGYETIVAMHTPGRSIWNGGGSHGVWTVNKNDNGGQPNEHPTTKPRTLIRKLVNLFSNPGEIILDPFLGSGTTAIAAKMEDRKYIGVELSETYCDLARRRVEAAPVPLFVTPFKEVA